MPNLSKLIKSMGDNVVPGQRIQEAVTAARLNAIMDSIRALARGDNIVAGSNLRKQSVSEGVMLSSNFAARDTTSAHPFKVYNASSGSVPAVRVRFGQVDSVTPTIVSVKLNDIDPPILRVSSGVVYLKVTVNKDGAVTSAEIGNASELPKATDTEGYITLASIYVKEGVVTTISQSVTHSLQHMLCGINQHLFGAV
jgi:hypothetical protein